MNYQFPHTMKSTYPDTKAKMRLKSSLEFGSLAKKKKRYSFRLAVCPLKFCVIIYPFHRYAVPLPLQEGQAYPCAALIFYFTIREILLNDAKKNVGAQTGGSHE